MFATGRRQRRTVRFRLPTAVLLKAQTLPGCSRPLVKISNPLGRWSSSWDTLGGFRSGRTAALREPNDPIVPHHAAGSRARFAPAMPASAAPGGRCGSARRRCSAVRASTRRCTWPSDQEALDVRASVVTDPGDQQRRLDRTDNGNRRGRRVQHSGLLRVQGGEGAGEEVGLPSRRTCSRQAGCVGAGQRKRLASCGPRASARAAGSPVRASRPSSRTTMSSVVTTSWTNRRCG